MEVRKINENKLECIVNDYTWSKMLTDSYGKHFKEQIPRDTWLKALEKNQPKIFINHQDYIEIGENISVEATECGVMLTLNLTDKEQNLYDAVKKGKVNSCSFGFKVLDEDRIEKGTYYERTINSMELYEISLLDRIPAYNNTSIEARYLNTFNNLSLLQKEIEVLKLK